MLRAAVDEDLPVPLEGGIEDGKRARRVDRVEQRDVAPCSLSEPLRRSVGEVDRVDEHRNAHRVPATVGQHGLEVLPERIAAQDAHLTDSVDPDGATVEPHNVLALERPRQPTSFLVGDAGAHESADQRADAGADDALRPVARFVDRAERTDVGQALDSAPSEDDPRVLVDRAEFDAQRL